MAHDHASGGLHTGGWIVISGIVLPEDGLWRFRLESGRFKERLDVEVIERVLHFRGEFGENTVLLVEKAEGSHQI
jgi:hypothetical protein